MRFILWLSERASANGRVKTNVRLGNEVEKKSVLKCLAFEENYCWTASVKLLCCIFCS